MIDKYKSSGLHGNEARDHWRKVRTQDLHDLCNDLGLELVKKSPYQYRVEGELDVYTTNGRWHDIKSGSRGDYHTITNLRKVLERVKGRHIL